MQYVYVIRRREHVRLNEPIYKVGMTYKQGFKRLLQYDGGVGFEIYSAIIVSNAKRAEAEIKELFNVKYDPVTDITGSTESYRGNIINMLQDIYAITAKYQRSMTLDELYDYLVEVNPLIFGHDEHGFFCNTEGNEEYMLDNIYYVALRRKEGGGYSILRPITDIEINDPFNFDEAYQLLNDELVDRYNFPAIVLGVDVDVDLEFDDITLKRYINRALEVMKSLY